MAGKQIFDPLSAKTAKKTVVKSKPVKKRKVTAKMVTGGRTLKKQLSKKIGLLKKTDQIKKIRQYWLNSKLL